MVFKKILYTGISLFLLLRVFSPSVLATDSQTLEKYLTVETAILQASDNVSLYFQNLEGNKQIAINPTRSWIPASTIKAFVLVEVFNQVRQGLISFDTPVTITANNVVATALETDDFPRLREGTQAAIRQLAEAMIIQSDNTAYNTLLDILDRRNINSTLKSLGLTETVVGEKLNLDDTQYSADSQVAGYQNNTTTAKDFASLFSLLAKNKIPGSPEMLAIFERQKFNDMIPALIPKSVLVAHKTGFWAPIYHDGGVVYKSGEPFILSIFSNSNDPSINARLAKVAYYQNTDSVGLSTDPGPDIPKAASNYPTITLAQIPNDNDLKVLAVETSSKFPVVTAADLGITSQDVTVGIDDSKNIKPAIIYPDSLAYLVKRGLETIQLALARNTNEKTNVLLNISHARLSEIKALKQANRPDLVGALVKDEQSSLSQAVNLAKSGPRSEQQLTQAKQLSDMSFVVAGDSLSKAKGPEKEKLIDNIYASYQRNQKEVAPIVQKSLPTSPFNQPLVGTVEKVEDNKITVGFTDGSTKTVLLTSTTPSRSFGEKTLDQGTPQASIGAKIAIVGEMTKNGEIIPNFILRNIPKSIPEKKEGVVIKIDSKNSSLDIKQANGQTATIVVSQDTIVKGRDTNVSISGIKAGSAVTIYGTSSPISTPSAVTPTALAKPDQKKSLTPVVSIKATTVTVTKNSSGKNEKVEKKEKAPSKSKAPEKKP